MKVIERLAGELRFEVVGLFVLVLMGFGYRLYPCYALYVPVKFRIYGVRLN
jgi:hypothetical protein